jgi:hypothetical protein
VRELLSSAKVQGATAVYASHIDGTLSSNSIRRKRRVTFEYVALSPRIIQHTNHLVMRFQWINLSGCAHHIAHRGEKNAFLFLSVRSFFYFTGNPFSSAHPVGPFVIRNRKNKTNNNS